MRSPGDGLEIAAAGVRENSPSGFEARLLFLMGARLALSVVSLGLAAALEAAGWSYSPAEWRGFYGTVVFAFLATIGYRLFLGRVRNEKRFAAINIATDIAIVSALVHVSGGSDSPFTFLYVLVAVYGAVLLERRGAVVCAVASALVYGGVLMAEQQGWTLTPSAATREPGYVLIGLWTVHTGAIVLVAALASLLSAELRRTGKALEQRTNDLSRLTTLHQRTVESLMSGLLTTDLDDRVTSFNPEAERITGAVVRDVLGRDVEEILPGIRSLVLDAAEGGERSRSRARTAYRSRCGEQRHLGVAAYVLRDSESQAVGYVVIFQDVTDVVAMEASLRRSERLAAVGELSARIAHEIRNPLAAISGSIEMLQTQRVAPNPVAESEQLMAIVLREVDRLNRLITDFLHFARPGPRHVEAVRVGNVVGEVMKMFEAVRPEGVEIEIDVDERLGVMADVGQLQQVLWNLVLNAAQAMPEGGRLGVSARLYRGEPPQEVPTEDRRVEEVGEKARWVEIAVEDDGVGVPPEVLDRIFDPFFTTKKSGTGLGLATVHRIVEDHGGVVRLETEVGAGTTMRIRLPRAEATT